MRVWIAIVLVVTFSFICVAQTAGNQALSSTFTNWLNHPAILYSTTQSTDLVAKLISKIDAGQIMLNAEGPAGYLRSLLAALKIPVSSQVALFQRDSVQAGRISESNPRTLFYNDSVVVGWVGGGFIEIAAQDPSQAVVFYTLTDVGGRPRIQRDNRCLTCHYSYESVGVPGMLLRSTDENNVDHRLAMKQRWGGWYVTGTLGTNSHRGVEITDKFDGRAYLSRNSDAVALLVFDHQMHMMNLLSRIGWEARVAENPMNGDRPTSLDDAAKEVVDYMLFAEEAPLAGKLQGSTDFATQFAAQGPKDRKGRSLRELDLQRRLLRYPCSYMIYSVQFDSLPSSAKNSIYQRMWQILSGRDKAESYSRLSHADRLAVVEILMDTRKDLPGYFNPAAVK